VALVRASHVSYGPQQQQQPQQAVMHPQQQQEAMHMVRLLCSKVLGMLGAWWLGVGVGEQQQGVEGITRGRAWGGCLSSCGVAYDVLRSE
jgi:hypothetical protein